MQAQSGLVALGTRRWTQITDAVLEEKMFRVISGYGERQGDYPRLYGMVSTWKLSADSETRSEREGGVSSLRSYVLQSFQGTSRAGFFAT